MTDYYYCPLCNLERSTQVFYYEKDSHERKYCCLECKLKIKPWWRMISK